MKNKVSIKIQGGLANNLFQIACAYVYSLKYNKELVLVNEKFGITHNALDTYKSNILSNVTFVQKCDISKFSVYNEPFFHFHTDSFHLDLEHSYMTERSHLDHSHLKEKR